MDFINAKRTPFFTAKHFRLLHVLIIVAVALAIAGGTSSKIEPNGTFKLPTTSKVGVILYAVAYVLIAAVYILSVPRTSAVPTRERRVPIAVTLALPLILFRLIYSLCAVFLHNKDFNLVTGSVWVFGFMAVAEEFLVVFIYIMLGFFVDKLAPAATVPATYPSGQSTLR